MRRNKKRKTRLVAILLILFLLISVGYASLTTNVSTSGGATIKVQRWRVYFDNIEETTGSVTANPAPTTSGITTTELNWTVSMDTPGQFYEFCVDVVNAGTMDAMVGSLVNTALASPQSNYFNYTVTYSDGSPIEQYDKLPANTTDTLKIRVEFRTDINPGDLPETAQEVSLTYTSTYVQANNNAKTRNRHLSGAIIKLGNKTVGASPIALLVGDEKEIEVQEGVENVTYTSSATSVATVDANGNVEVVGVGTAVITITGATSGEQRTITINAVNAIDEATVKVDGKTVENENVKIAIGATKAITVENGENVTYASSNTSVATVDNSGNITIDAGATVGQTLTITLTGAISGEERTFTVEVKEATTIGSSVSYSTTLNGQTLDDWSVFYIDGDYTYIILDDYLPRTAISNNLKANYNLVNGNGNLYTIRTTANKRNLINAMATTSNWADLINNGEIDGTALSSAVKSDTKVKAMGAPNIELWANSWNSAINGFTTTITTSQNATGYQVNGANVLSISSEDKSKENYSLYFPHTINVDLCSGYWLASPSAYDSDRLICIYFSGQVSYTSYGTTDCAFRPIVCLPTSILE
ncbi:MAG: Ig-like domain-containing protein [Clostridia bacterium]|nr:Ig-like domain-containing protein [Clostridia bacterium]